MALKTAHLDRHKAHTGTVLFPHIFDFLFSPFAILFSPFIYIYVRGLGVFLLLTLPYNGCVGFFTPPASFSVKSSSTDAGEKTIVSRHQPSAIRQS